MNKFNRFLILLAALLAVLALFACGDTPAVVEGENSTTPAQTTAAPQPTEPPAVYGLTVGESLLYPGADPADLLPALGEPIDRLEAPSCVHDGMDRVYYYAGYEINTNPTADGGEVIVSIYLSDDSITTDEGLRIGDSAEKITQLYGEVTPEGGVYVYTKTDRGVSVSLNIQTNGSGEVTSIFYN